MEISMSVWQQVIFSTEGDPRTGHAGTVVGVNPADPDRVAVQWDAGVTELVAVADLRAL
jgi:hypothetical protein